MSLVLPSQGPPEPRKRPQEPRSPREGGTGGPPAGVPARSRHPGDPQALTEAVTSGRAVRRELLRRKVLAGDVETLAARVLGYEVRPFHREMIRFQSAHRHSLQLAPRGYGKSTVLTIARSIYEVLRDANIRILIVSNTQNQAEGFLREIKSHLASNTRLIEAFGRFEDETKWDQREIVVKPRTSPAKESTVTCVGVEGPVASRHYDLILCDDLVVEVNARTELQRESVKTWYYKTLLPCLEPDGRLHLIGTRYHFLDLYGHLIANELSEHHQIVRAIGEGGTTPWPEKFPLAHLEQKRREMGSTIFATQYQNDVELMKGEIFKEEWFKTYETVPDWSRCEHWIGCDPAATKADVLLSGRKASSDYWTIALVAREKLADGGYGRELYVRELVRVRCTKQEYVDRVKAMNERYRPVEVAVEAVAAQEYLAQDLERYVPVKRVERTKDKVSRAYWLQAFFENGQILFPAKPLRSDPDVWRALEEELILFPSAEHDDLFDALQTAVETAMEGTGGFFCFWGEGPANDDLFPEWPAHSRTIRIPWMR